MEEVFKLQTSSLKKNKSLWHFSNSIFKSTESILKTKNTKITKWKKKSNYVFEFWQSMTFKDEKTHNSAIIILGLRNDNRSRRIYLVSLQQNLTLCTQAAHRKWNGQRCVCSTFGCLKANQPMGHSKLQIARCTKTVA